MRVSHISLPLARRWTHGAVPRALALVATLALTACINDYEDDLAIAPTSLRVEMTLATRAADIPTSNGGTNYFEEATAEECYINSVHIYLFTYTGEASQGSGSDDNGTFLAELTGTAVGSINSGKCTATGIIDRDVLAAALTSDDTAGTADLSNVSFRVAVCANWDSYPTNNDLTSTFTIDDLCAYNPTDGTTTTNWSTYSYDGDFTPTATKGIPYFGIQEFTGEDLSGATLDLSSSSIYLLRAMARIEVVYDFTDENDTTTDPIGTVVLHHYNATGYCAPKGVYTRKDYYTSSTTVPDSDSDLTNWTGNYDQNGVHLVGDNNDTDENGSETVSNRAVTLKTVEGGYTDGDNTTHDCWRAYVPEYSNQGNDYAYIQIYWSNELDESSGEPQSTATEHKVYFASYDEDGSTDAYDEDKTVGTDGYYTGRVDIHRNYLYRFFVRPAEDNTVTVTVTVENWTYDTKEYISDDDLSDNE